MQQKSFHIKSLNDFEIPAYSWLPDAEPVAVLYIVHGMAEYGQRYNEVATILAAESIAVFATDNRSHGSAVPDLSQLGIGEENWFYKSIVDIQSVITQLRKSFPGKKIFLLGHSMGSFLCQRYFQLHGKDLDGLVLSATNGQPDPLLNMGIAVAFLQKELMGRSHRSKLINTLSFGKFNKAFRPNRTAFDWLSREESEVDKYVADPLCGYTCSSQFFYYFFKGIKDVLKPQNISAIPLDVPVYCFAGDEDPVGLQGKGFMKLISKWKAAGLMDITFHLYKTGRHEMLNETNRPEVISNLVSWIKKTTKNSI